MEELIVKIGRQFLTGLPLKSVDWQIGHEDFCDANLQVTLLNNTIRHPLTKRYQLSPDYKRAFLKFVITELEKSGTEVLGEFYEEYAFLLEHTGIAACSYNDRVYVVDDDLHIGIQECTAIISEGTTGLITWPAAKALAEFCLENDSMLKDRNILELGCGLGFTGLVVCKRCRPRSYVFSDYHTRVLDALRHNLNLNLVSEMNESLKETTNDIVGNEFSWGTSKATVMSFHWDDTEQLSALKNWQNYPEVILAADVIYDVELIPSFLNVLITLFNWNSAPADDNALDRPIKIECCALVALTERNLETVATFFREAENRNFLCEDQPQAKSLFYFDRTCPIRVMKLSQTPRRTLGGDNVL